MMHKDLKIGEGGIERRGERKLDLHLSRRHCHQPNHSERMLGERRALVGPPQTPSIQNCMPRTQRLQVTNSFTSTLDVFIGLLFAITNESASFLPPATAMRFLFSPSITETAKLYHNTHKLKQYHSKKEWKYFLIQFVDFGALLEFKHLIARVGKDMVQLVALQWLLLHYPRGQRNVQPSTEGSPMPLLISVVAQRSTRINADITWCFLSHLSPLTTPLSILSPVPSQPSHQSFLSHQSPLLPVPSLTSPLSYQSPLSLTSPSLSHQSLSLTVPSLTSPLSLSPVPSLTSPLSPLTNECLGVDTSLQY
jgi:hypothetical protein